MNITYEELRTKKNRFIELYKRFKKEGRIRVGQSFSLNKITIKDLAIRCGLNYHYATECIRKLKGGKNGR